MTYRAICHFYNNFCLYIFHVHLIYRIFKRSRYENINRPVPGIHFFTLNRSPATRMIVSALRNRE